ncbi:MAG: hypothetical protein ACO2PN_22095 [Pyrobaculum sp.]
MMIGYIRRRFRLAAGLNGVGPVEAVSGSGGLGLECLRCAYAGWW